MSEILLQPKQYQMLQLILDSPAVVIGVGGGRGAAKSSGADRVAITLMHMQKDAEMCMIMRTWPQLNTFHLEAIKATFPFIKEGLKVSPPAKLEVGGSRMDFKYAENYDGVVQTLRSGNYRYIFIDQAEQFTEREIREIRKANRSTRQTAKIILLFNMRGAGIQTLRKWFYLKELNKDEKQSDYTFLKVNPWDNIEWVRTALESDNYTEHDYYSWTDQQRHDYAKERGEYTRQLASDDEVIRAADWYGSWDSLEGAYFSNSFDLEATRINPIKAETIRKNWASHWTSQDWGKAHYCATYWFFRVTLSPQEIQKYLGWDWRFDDSLNVIVCYREMIVSELSSSEVARRIVDCTPVDERKKLRSYFLSPECVTDDPNSVGSQQSKELRAMGLPGATKADNDRIGGAALIENLLKATKYKGIDPKDGRPYQNALLISSECPELLKAIPMLMRDPKDLNDVLKTDKGQAKIEQDIYDACFVWDTPVLTGEGWVPIAWVLPGDMVLTRKGWKKVRRAWRNRENAPVVKATFSNGCVLTCTSDHKFYTDSGWKMLRDIGYDDKITVCEKQSPSWAAPTTDTQNPVSYQNSGTLLAHTNFSTAPSGKTLTETYRKVTTYITRMATGITTTFPTLKPCPVASILATTPGQECIAGLATSAEKNSLGPVFVQEDSVPKSVKLNGEGIASWITRKLSASFAALKSSKIGSLMSEHVPVSAVRLCGLETAGFADVYDLEVEDTHEFFANGILAHNCRYGLKSMLSPKKKSDKDAYNERMDVSSPTERMLLAFKNQQKKVSSKRQIMPASWKGNL